MGCKTHTQKTWPKWTSETDVSKWSPEGATHVQMAQWSRWKHQMVAPIKLFKSGPRGAPAASHEQSLTYKTYARKDELYG